MIDLSKITDQNDIREMCRVPLRLNDGRVVATDGYKLVCVDSFDGDASALMAATEPLNESICKMLAAHSGATDWQPVASLNMPAPDPCVKCMGSGALIATKCEECSKCFGTGHQRTPVTVPGLPDARAADAAYLSAFPHDAEIAAMPYNGSHILALRGDGWIGVLAPMRTR